MVGAALGASFACADVEPFSCTGDSACDLEVGGRCEADGHCSYPDATCPLGRRYRDAASGNACIGGTGADTETGTGSDTESETETESDSDTGTGTGTDTDADTDTDTE